MDNINLWESNLKDKYLYFSTIEEYFKYLQDNNKNLSFVVKDSFSEGNTPEDNLDNAAIRDNINITYTDNIHPIVISKTEYTSSYINQAFFEEHKNEFIKYAKAELAQKIKDKASYITIPDFIYENSLIDKIIQDESLRETVFTCRIFTTDNLEIPDEIKQKLIDNHLEFSINYRIKQNEKISTKYVFIYYTIKELKEITSLRITVPTTENIENLKYLNKNAKITIDQKYNQKKDEAAYFKNIIEIIKILSRTDNNYNLEFQVENRELFRRSNLLNYISDNINIIIKNDLYEYDIETYQKEEEKLEKLAAPIRNSNLSPFEKYLAAYNIAKKFKPYNENEEDKNQARYLRYLLDDSNEYIVCVGFSKILQELLNRIGISNKTISVSVDTSYDEGFTQEEKNIDLAGHARNLIKITDSKYGINGYYIADSTWDNSMANDIYLNSLLTFDRKKEAVRLEKLQDEDLLLDFHNLKDFQDKISYLIKKTELSDYSIKDDKEKIKKFKKELQENISKTKDSNEIAKLNSDYIANINKINNNIYIRIIKSIINKVMNLLVDLDYEKYDYFYKKYTYLLNENDISVKDAEQIFNDFLNEYFKYIIPLSNNIIKIDDIIKAATTVKRKIDGYNETELQEWLNNTREKNQQYERSSFPYRYNPELETEAYLESAIDIDEEEKKSHTR